jgi:autoinducer 2-degrading protein
MIATLVHVEVKAEFIELFVAATRHNHEKSVKEPGNFRFDILQDSINPGKFVLYEVYDSDTDVTAHKQTTHYITWRDTVEPWMAKPRAGIKHTLLFPQTR